MKIWLWKKLHTKTIFFNDIYLFCISLFYQYIFFDAEKNIVMFFRNKKEKNKQLDRIMQTYKHLQYFYKINLKRKKVLSVITKEDVVWYYKNEVKKRQKKMAYYLKPKNENKI